MKKVKSKLHRASPKLYFLVGVLSITLGLGGMIWTIINSPFSWVSLISILMVLTIPILVIGAILITRWNLKKHGDKEGEDRRMIRDTMFMLGGAFVELIGWIGMFWLSKIGRNSDSVICSYMVILGLGFYVLGMRK